MYNTLTISTVKQNYEAPSNFRFAIKRIDFQDILYTYANRSYSIVTHYIKCVFIHIQLQSGP